MFVYFFTSFHWSSYRKWSAISWLEYHQTQKKMILTVIPAVTFRGQKNSSYRLQAVFPAFLFKSASLNLKAADMKCPRSQKYLRNANNFPISACLKKIKCLYRIHVACSCSTSKFMPPCVFQEGREWLLKSVALWLPGHKQNAASSGTDADAQVSVWAIGHQCCRSGCQPAEEPTLFSAALLANGIVTLYFAVSTNAGTPADKKHEMIKT